MIHLNFETTLDCRKINDEQYSKNTQNMKRDLDKLTKGDVQGITRWLSCDKTGKRKFCPFTSKTCKTCGYIFPRLPEDPMFCELECPCNVYSVKYVTRVAKQITKEWNDND